MNPLLTIAELIAGRPARQRVFELLLADWQRELAEAKRNGPISYLLASTSGCLGFARAVLYCAVSEGVWIPPLSGTLLSLGTVTVAILLSIGVLLISPPRNLPRDLSLPAVQSWVLIWSGTIVPPAFLLATFLLRRDPRATVRHATVFTLVAGAAATAIVVNTSDGALRQRFDTFAASERMREFSLASHRAGRSIYVGRRYQQELATTVEQRRARFERYQTQMAAFRHDPPPTWSRRIAQASPVLLAVLFAIMGWTLAGLGAPTISRGFGWWALVFAAMIAMTRILSNLVGVPMPRPPQWLILPIFISILLALIVGTRRVHNTQWE